MGAQTDFLAPESTWALDVTLTMPCFVPVELDAEGRITNIVTGMNVISEECPGKLVAVIHEDGQSAVEAWLANASNQRWLDSIRSKIDPAPEKRAAR